MSEKNEMIIIYGVDGCSKCFVLKNLLKTKGLPFVENRDENIMKEKGFLSIPMIEKSDGTILNFSQALAYLNNKGENIC